jgi:spore coat polysaccharide biosynthesis predicted glycosyltransferase SpsG
MIIKQNRILFRCDQNEVSGFGHFSRSLNLARLIKEEVDVEISFLGNYDDFGISLLNKYGISYQLINDTKFSEFDEEYISQFSHVVTDSYLFQNDYIKKITKLDLFTIFIDDTNELDFTNVDLVINFRIGVEHFKYNSKDMALGPEYFIYKPEFLAIRNDRVQKNEIKKVFLFHGGMDISTKSYNNLVDKLLEYKKDIRIDVVTKNPQKFKKREGVEFYFPSFEIEKFYKETDLVINGGGLTKYESCFNLIPSASFAMTELQNEDSIVLESLGLICNFGMIRDFKALNIKEKLEKLLNSITYRDQLVNACESIFTTGSVKNILNKITFN